MKNYMTIFPYLQESSKAILEVRSSIASFVATIISILEVRLIIASFVATIISKGSATN